MERADILEARVRELYEARDPNRADWADWLSEHHVFVVADSAEKLAEKYSANIELSVVAAVLHDIADTKMKRQDELHAEESMLIARELMREAGFNEQEIALVVDDAIKFHSCRDKVPESLEGKILATADSLAHLKTDFYIFATWALGREKSYEEVKAWADGKIDRDFYGKILFEDERNSAEPDYKRLKVLFSR